MVRVDSDMTYNARAGAVLFARDLNRVAAFYSVVLGLVEEHRDDDHILLESPGFQLVVHRLVGDGLALEVAGATPHRRAEATFKPVFFVPSISTLRSVVEAHGGVIEPVEHEWTFNGVKVCDGLDPEGNVVQFREHHRAN